MNTPNTSRSAEREVRRWNADLPRTASDVLAALISIGDALRADIEIPSALRTWMRELGRAEVEAALTPLADEAKGWLISPSMTLPTEERREEAESARRAVMRIAMQSQWTTQTLTQLVVLGDAIRRVDSASAEKAAHSVSNDDDRSGAGQDSLSADDSRTLAKHALLDAAVPDDDIVLSYVKRGALARYVEGVADTNPDFREELTACIDALSESGESVSDSARAWRGARAVNVSSSHQSAPAVAQVVTRLDDVRRRSSSRRTVIALTLSIAAAIVIGIGGFSQYAGMKEAERTAALREREIADNKAQLDKLMAELKAQEEAVAAAQAEAANAKTEADRASAQAKLMAAQDEQRKTQANVSNRTTAAGAGSRRNKARAACTCVAGDPLCSCL